MIAAFFLFLCPLLLDHFRSFKKEYSIVTMPVSKLYGVTNNCIVRHLRYQCL
jgi:hypothetical protein